MAQRLHFGRAAADLSITQPVLSDQIRRLETLLGVQLLHRTKRVVRLTEPGRIFLTEAQRTLEQTEAAIATVRRAAAGKLGKLTIGYTGPALYTVLPQILQSFRARYPEVELTLRELCTPEQEAALMADTIQVGFLHPPIDAPLCLREVLSEPTVVALPENHPLAARSRLSVRDPAPESFILFPRSVGPVLYSEILALCAQAGFSPRIVQEVTPQPTMVGLVAAGMGVAFVAESLQNISRPGVAYRSLQEPTPVLQLAIAWKANTHAPDPVTQASPVLQSFLQVVADWCAQH